MNVSAQLNTQPNIERPDDFYQLLVDAHRDLSPAPRRLMPSPLILLIANHVGDISILSSALEAARKGIVPSRDARGQRPTA